MLTIPRLRRAALIYLATSLALLITAVWLVGLDDNLAEASGWTAALLLFLLALPFTVAGIGIGYLFVSWDMRKR